MTTPGVNYLDYALGVSSNFNDSAEGITITTLAKGGATPNEYLDMRITLSNPPASNALAYVSGTLAGAAGVAGNTNGAAGDARFSSPTGVAVDDGGNVYVTEIDNLSIREITSQGQVSTVATGFVAPFNLAADHATNLYVADFGLRVIDKISPGGTVTTLAGLASQVGTADRTGSAARFTGSFGIATDDAGNVYVTDQVTVRKITPDGTVTTLAGAAGRSGSNDGSGTNAAFSN